MLQAERVTKWYGERVLFSEFSARLVPGDRVALVGDNGTGKSTLLGILAGELEPSAGKTVRPSDLRVSYLHQVARLEGEETLCGALRSAFGNLERIERALRSAEDTWSESPDDRAAAHYDELLSAFEREGGYVADARIRAALAGVGFDPTDHDRPVTELSGGEQARAALARALVSRPDVLLLDEPTNHLDFDGLDWLEGELCSYPGILVLVSHDRHLLGRVTNRTWEIDGGRMQMYRVGYAHSRQLRDADRARQQQEHDRQQDQAAQYRQFIDRHRAGQKHRQAKDREKKLARLEAEFVDAVRDRRAIALEMPTSARGGRRVLTTDGLEIGVDRPLARLPRLLLERGDRVAIVGPNGSGKTTLLRTIAGEIAPQSGSLTVGHGIRATIFRQTQEGLFGNASALETILAHTELTRSKAWSLLGRFQFSGTDVDKRMCDLSGGERSRVALALLSMMRGNLLLLDEPTNHLDLASQEALERALGAYDGTILLVSHDRALLEAVATQVWAFEDGSVHVTRSGFEDYRARQRERLADRRKAVDTAPKKRDASRAQGPVPRPSAAALDAIERRIEAFEQELDQIESQLLIATREGDAARIARLGAAHKEASEALNEQIAEWGRLAAEQ
ncbi:MAG: ABC-F family ATP-binding cassette domain-containing protein, partial [Candidatus Bipolaricaulota bacterium]